MCRYFPGFFAQCPNKKCSRKDFHRRALRNEDEPRFLHFTSEDRKKRDDEEKAEVEKRGGTEHYKPDTHPCPCSSLREWDWDVYPGRDEDFEMFCRVCVHQAEREHRRDKYWPAWYNPDLGVEIKSVKMPDFLPNKMSVKRKEESPTKFNSGGAGDVPDDSSEVSTTRPWYDPRQSPSLSSVSTVRQFWTAKETQSEEQAEAEPEGEPEGQPERDGKGKGRSS